MIGEEQNGLEKMENLYGIKISGKN